MSFNLTVIPDFLISAVSLLLSRYKSFLADCFTSSGLSIHTYPESLMYLNLFFIVLFIVPAFLAFISVGSCGITYPGFGFATSYAKYVPAFRFVTDISPELFVLYLVAWSFDVTYVVLPFCCCTYFFNSLF